MSINEKNKNNILFDLKIDINTEKKDKIIIIENIKNNSFELKII